MLPPQRALTTLLFCGIAAAFSLTASAQILTPDGGEYRISGALPGDQVYPALAVNPSGGYLTWQDSKLDANGQGVGAVRLDGNLNSVGDPFRVSQKTRGHQQHPQVALLANDNAIFVWQSGQRGTNDVFARFVRPDGSFVTGDIQVSPSVRIVRTNYIMEYFGFRNNRMINRRSRVTDSFKALRANDINPVVASLADGGAVVAYTGTRRLYTNFNQIVQKITRSHGRYYTNDLPQRASAFQDWMQDVFFQRFDAEGRKAGGEVLVNQWAKYNQRDASVAARPGGGFVVAWVSEKAILNYFRVDGIRAGSPTLAAQIDINARLFNASGEPLGNEFTVNTAPWTCATPAVSALADGRFTIVWKQRDGVTSDGWDIYARLFNADGTSSNAVMRVNDYTYGDQFSPRIASLGTLQMIVWSSLGQDDSWEEVYGQLFVEGMPVGGEFRANTTTLGRQIHPAVIADEQGGFAVAWSGFDTDLETSFDVYAQRYTATQPSSASPGGAVAFINLQVQQLSGNQRGLAFPALPPIPGIMEASDERVTGEISLPRLSFKGSPGNMELNWNTQPGVRYQVQVSTNLKTWSNVGEPRIASVASDRLDLDLTGTAVFYRVLRLP